LTEVDRRLKQQTDEVNAALAELTRQVNVALGKAGSAPATKAGKSPNAPAAQAETPATAEDGGPAGVPRTGIIYRVKSGDTVTKIAQRNGSKVDWILKANNLSSAAALKADVDVFVPQAETPAR
jgi:LysM repeat protein